MRIDHACIVVVALAWGSYPLVSRSSGLGGPIGALILTLASLVPLTVITLVGGGFERPPTAAVLKLCVAGVVMGVGTAAFNFVVNSRSLDASVSIPIVDTAMIAVSVLLAAVFFGEHLTPRKLAGLALLLAGIFALRPD